MARSGPPTDAAAATGGRKSTADWQANGVSIDTRTLQPGDLFVALKDVRDGHDFVAAGAGQGRRRRPGHAAVPEGVAADAPLLIVPDVLQALDGLGRAARARTRARVVGVTGSVGKTSTKEMLRAILAGQGRTHAAEASYNNHWGVPLTLARMPADTDFAVIEIGMNHPGEIAPLARLARLDVAMITTVAPAHLEAFDEHRGHRPRKGRDPRRAGARRHRRPARRSRRRRRSCWPRPQRLGARITDLRRGRDAPTGG